MNTSTETAVVAAAETRSTSNAEVLRVYKEVQALGLGWKEIGSRLGLKPNAAQGRVNTLKAEMFAALAAMKNSNGERRYSADEIDALILRSFPAIKRTGGGRTSDKKEVIEGLIADLGLDLSESDAPTDSTDSTEPTESAETTETTVEVQ
jgi:hypothetical protein